MFAEAAQIIRYHHAPWNLVDKTSCDPQLYYLANLLNLADRVDVLLISGEPTGPQLASILRRIKSQEGFFFATDGVKALEKVIAEVDLDTILTDGIGHLKDISFEPLSYPQILRVTFGLSQIIDFRSRFTATHSRGVAEAAVRLAQICGMGPLSQRHMRIAGNMHDIGKLAIDPCIIEKAGRLTEEEYLEVQRHPAVARNILSQIQGFETISMWACQHHERLDGSGYPDGLKSSEISYGAKIMAVADVFTAITEDRPYRAGMDRNQTKKTLLSLCDNNILDPKIVTALLDNIEDVNLHRRQVQNYAAKEFMEFTSPVQEDQL